MCVDRDSCMSQPHTHAHHSVHGYALKDDSMSVAVAYYTDTTPFMHDALHWRQL